MAITAITRDQGIDVSIVRMVSTSTLAQVATAGYLTAQADNIADLNKGEWTWLATDMIACSASDGHQIFVFSGSDFTSLIQLPGGNGAVTLPVVANDFAVFDGTLGAIKDLGFSASDATKTKVVMAGSATVVNHIAKFVDTAGTVDDTAGAAINSGDIQAGLSGTAGKLISYPGTGAKGSLQVVGVANTGDTISTISNNAMGQATVANIPDPANAIAQFLIAATATPFVSGNIPFASGTGGLMVDSGFGVNNILRYATVAITAAQFNGMYAAPFLLIAAPGANNLIVVDRIELIMTYGTAAFAAGGVVAFQYDSTVHGAGVLASNAEAAADFFQTASTTFTFIGNSGNTVGIVPFSTSVNKGLYISNLTQAFTTGDSTFVCKIHYRIVAVA